MEFTGDIDSYLNRLKDVLDKLSRVEIGAFTRLLLNAYENNKKIFIFGNGGSAATASHFACDINKGVSYEMEKKFRVVCLNDNIPTMTAYANDVDYEDVFLEQLKNYIDEGDLVIGISGSGNSKNVLKAIEFANINGNVTIGITGYNGGRLKEIARYSVNANINDMQLSEDVHLILTHLVMKMVQKELKP